jgi:hypothetical protein
MLNLTSLVNTYAKCLTKTETFECLNQAVYDYFSPLKPTHDFRTSTSS